MSMKLLSKPFEQVVCQFAEGDIPPVPKVLLFYYIEIEKRLKFESLGFINLDDLFGNTTLSTRDRFDFMTLLKRFGLIEYTNIGDRNFKVRLIPKSRCYKSGAIAMHQASGYHDMLAIIDRLKIKEDQHNEVL